MALGIREDDSFEKEKKLLDLIAFLYEIRQASVHILDSKKVGYASEMVAEQIKNIMRYCEKAGIPKDEVRKFLKDLKLN